MNQKNLLNETFNKHLKFLHKKLNLKENINNTFVSELKKFGFYLAENDKDYSFFKSNNNDFVISLNKETNLWNLEEIDKNGRDIKDYLKKGSFDALKKSLTDLGVSVSTNESSDESDMIGKKCERCKKGTYGERSQHDDMQGMVTCDKCGHRVKRWKKI